MVAKMRFWLPGRSMSITKALLSVMILKSVLWYFNNWAMFYEEINNYAMFYEEGNSTHQLNHHF